MHAETYDACDVGTVAEQLVGRRIDTGIHFIFGKEASR